uniref:ARAD1D11088p n=1 Tax=Blastobotrys adeninivorans TaxID=409370 RepID=A0A060T8G2_BLAAD
MPGTTTASSSATATATGPTSSGFVNPSMVYSMSTPGGPSVTPNTPKTFSSIVSSSPLYPGYYSSPPEPPLHDTPTRPATSIGLQNSPLRMSQNHGNLTRSSSIRTGRQSTLESPFRASSVSLSSTAFESMSRNNSSADTSMTTDSSFSFKPSQGLLRTFSDIRPSSSFRRPIAERRIGARFKLARPRVGSHPDAGPLSAPIQDSYPGLSLKRRVSFNISRGRAVVEAEDDDDDGRNDSHDDSDDEDRESQGKFPRTDSSRGLNVDNYVMKRSKTVRERPQEKSESSRRMSLESLFPELSPGLVNSPKTPQVAKDAKEMSDDERLTINSHRFSALSLDRGDDDPDDARQALRRVLSRNRADLVGATF